MTEPEQIWVLDWQWMADEDALERVQWLRDNLRVGDDWLVCNDPRMCVLKTESAGVLYCMRWFDGSQVAFDPHDPNCVLRPYMSCQLEEEA